jgi:hypothetical protein
MLYGRYQAPLDLIRPFSPFNPRMGEYAGAAQEFLRRAGL